MFRTVLRRAFRTAVATAAPRRRPETRTLEAGSLAAKYKVFSDLDATIIKNTEEEALEPEQIEQYDEFEGIDLQRGVTGVFDIEDLVSVLKRENAKDIFVCAVAPENTYVDYICIVSGRSTRHMLAIAEFLRKLFKRKCRKGENPPTIEGKSSKDWMALDLGNIALHIFNEKVRDIYNLEMLWSVGYQHDDDFLKRQSSITQLVESHSIHLENLKPATKSNTSSENENVKPDG